MRPRRLPTAGRCSTGWRAAWRSSRPTSTGTANRTGSPSGAAATTPPGAGDARPGQRGRRLPRGHPGSYHFLEEPTPNWAQPPDVLFPHAVVDLNGDGRQEVLLTSLIGANTDHYGVLALTADRRLHAVQTRDEVQYLTAGGGAGYGSGYGCVTSGGCRLVADVGRSSDSSAAGPDGATFSWRATYSRLEDGTFTVLGSQGGYRTADTGDARPYALGGNSCSGQPPDIGIVQPPATDIAGALRGLLQAAARGDEAAGRYFVSGAAYPRNAPRDAWAEVPSLSRLPASTAEPQCRAVVESFGLPQPPYSVTSRTGVAVDALLSRDGNGQWVVDDSVSLRAVRDCPDRRSAQPERSELVVLGGGGIGGSALSGR